MGEGQRLGGDGPRRKRKRRGGAAAAAGGGRKKARGNLRVFGGAGHVLRGEEEVSICI